MPFMYPNNIGSEFFKFLYPIMYPKGVDCQRLIQTYRDKIF